MPQARRKLAGRFIERQHGADYYLNIEAVLSIAKKNSFVFGNKVYSFSRHWLYRIMYKYSTALLI
jgi:hypothetical protein